MRAATALLSATPFIGPTAALVVSISSKSSGVVTSTAAAAAAGQPRISLLRTLLPSGVRPLSAAVAANGGSQEAPESPLTQHLKAKIMVRSATAGLGEGVI